VWALCTRRHDCPFLSRRGWIVIFSYQHCQGVLANQTLFMICAELRQKDPETWELASRSPESAETRTITSCVIAGLLQDSCSFTTSVHTATMRREETRDSVALGRSDGYCCWCWCRVLRVLALALVQVQLQVQTNASFPAATVASAHVFPLKPRHVLRCIVLIFHAEAANTALVGLLQRCPLPPRVFWS